MSPVVVDPGDDEIRIFTLDEIAQRIMKYSQLNRAIAYAMAAFIKDAGPFDAGWIGSRDL